jgi:hypothetical protein
MSYDISLYAPSFLRAAIASGLGDWRNAPPFGDDVRSAIIRAAEAEGFVESPHPPGFVEFMKSQGTMPSTDFRLVTSQLDLEMQLFENSVALVVQAKVLTADLSIAFTRNFGQRLSRELKLGFYDPQEGEVWCGEA